MASLGARVAAATGFSEAYCAVLCDGEAQNCLEALVLGHSVAVSGSTRDRVLLYSPNIPTSYLDVLTSVWQLQVIGKDWARLPGCRKFGSATAASRLTVLQLRTDAKVIILDLGVVVCRNLDSLFNLDCPAAAFHSTQGGKTLDASLLLLQPDVTAMNRIIADIGGNGPAGPPRPSCPANGHEGASADLFEEYLTCFYNCFYGGNGMTSPMNLCLYEPLPQTAPRLVAQSFP